MANNNKDIIYKIKLPTISASEIIYAEVNDFNTDGLKDIKVITDIIEDINNGPFECIFFQESNGLFRLN